MSDPNGPEDLYFAPFMGTLRSNGSTRSQRTTEMSPAHESTDFSPEPLLTREHLRTDRSLRLWVKEAKNLVPTIGKMGAKEKAKLLLK